MIRCCECNAVDPSTWGGPNPCCAPPLPVEATPHLLVGWDRVYLSPESITSYTRGQRFADSLSYLSATRARARGVRTRGNDA